MPEIRTGSQWFLYVDRLLYKYEQTKSEKLLIKIYNACGIDALRIFAPGRSFTAEQLKTFPALEMARVVGETRRVSEIVRVLYDFIDSFPYNREENNEQDKQKSDVSNM